MEHLGCHLVGRAVRCVHHNLEPLQRQVVGKGAFAKLDVAPRRVIQPPRLAQAGRVGPHGGLGQCGLHRHLPLVRQLGALRTEELDAVVGIGVVAGADDHPQAGALGTRQVGHAGRGQGAQQHHIHTGRVEPGLQRALEHVAGYARVLADEDRGPLFGAAQHPPHRMGEAQNKIGGDGRLPHGAADAVGSKILACHAVASPRVIFVVFVGRRPLMPAWMSHAALRASSRPLHGCPHGQGRHSFTHVMHPHHRCTPVHRQYRCSHTGRQPILYLESGDSAQ